MATETATECRICGAELCKPGDSVALQLCQRHEQQERTRLYEAQKAERHSASERDNLLECVRKLLDCGFRENGGWFACRPNDDDLDYAAEVLKQATGEVR